MSYSSAPNQQTFVERIATLIEADTTLFPADGSPLLTKVLRNTPAIESAPETALPPFCIVRRSDTGPIELRTVGRDSRTAKGGALWRYEFYVIVVVREITKSAAEQKLFGLASTIRQIFESNIHLTSGDSSLCRRLVTYEIPYLLRQDKPDYQALNIVVRPEVYIDYTD